MVKFDIVHAVLNIATDTIPLQYSILFSNPVDLTAQVYRPRVMVGTSSRLACNEFRIPALNSALFLT